VRDDGAVLDQIGDFGADPGQGWAVAGLPAATKDHTIVRKQHISNGNAGGWVASAGTNEADGEWTVLDRDAWWPVVERACEAGCSVGDCIGAPPGPPPAVAPPPPPPRPPPPPSPPQGTDPVQVPAAAALRTPTSLFFSASAEGNSYNKYLEIFNPSCADVSLDDYSFPTMANGPADGTPVMWDFENQFYPGAIVAAGRTFVICHPQADAAILANCDQVSVFFGACCVLLSVGRLNFV
jgi:hypothetical protein